MAGFIKLHRKFLKWEWQNDSKMVHLFLYIILSANFEPKKWQGIPIERGQFITGLKSLSLNTGLSIQSIRTCLKKLQNTKEITIKPTNKYSVITVVNYNTYQLREDTTNKQTNKPTTNNQQSNNIQSTTTKKDKKVNNDKNKIDFNIFWNLYNKKVDKVKSKKEWDALDADIQDKIIKMLPKYIMINHDLKYRKNPFTFLDGQCWNDELIESNGEQKHVMPSNYLDKDKPYQR